MPIIRDPVHNSLQCKYGTVWCGEEKVLAVYSKDKRPDLQNLPTGWEIEGEVVNAKKPYNYCGIKIEKELTEIKVIGPSGAVSQLLGSCLKDNPMLLTQPVVNPDDDSKDETVIYPLNELNLKR